MKMKKIISSVTLLALSTLVLAACGGDKKDDTKTAKDSSASSSSVVKTETSKSSTSSETKTDAKADLKDGEYTLEEKNESNGYRTVFTIVVKDGKISESKYDNINKDGESKTADTKYNKMMKDKSGTSPDIFIPELNKALVEAQDPEVVDTVSGATSSSETFKDYAKQLVEAAKKGDTAKIEIDNKVEKK
ncbi:FMN-binding protein [Vagococcus vulneris]|uniref:FMN-binding domain-containing protein n=1 Tax=Vagococcus vulneris TaxID=1977869 RepID=A0A429ZUK7_9ENTE|nr:FMN-binding protein [Vagococcus vulneris]RST97376.1 hypothetical protein CBF37_09860 [Vagococcus vulneris]